ncbi:hypothetical protein [Pseudonocardia lacus]|uniref:hypothetical protein n=1 Tax=Pseudonocardia lacus TaxID=2835865 RepID=UPI001BDDAE8F|nr:hypothetical protein [Pseudonocardia lacus]
MAALTTLAIAGAASADPAPGFEFDPVALEQRLDDCLSYVSAPDAILMGWINLRNGQQRQWRCSSLRHMMRHDEPERPVHDPFVGLGDFMRCVDEVVSYGFPRKNTGVPWNVALIKQYQGTSSRAIVTVNELTGDIVTIYTEPRPDDWAGCVAPL